MTPLRRKMAIGRSADGLVGSELAAGVESVVNRSSEVTLAGTFTDGSEPVALSPVPLEHAPTRSTPPSAKIGHVRTTLRTLPSLHSLVEIKGQRWALRISPHRAGCQVGRHDGGLGRISATVPTWASVFTSLTVGESRSRGLVGLASSRRFRSLNVL